ncbi:MAG: hypothetical protein PHX08_01115 [Lachnospiraceae bacterium]|nr:hypothetical protein [Lachnospiraceae bacterium]
MKLGELEQRCGNCGVMDLCAEPYNELCLCTNAALADMTEENYEQYANMILGKQYYKNKKLAKIIAKRISSEYSEIYAIDFDGTLHTGEWPKIGEPNTRLIKKLIQRQLEGATLILWTCREKEVLEEAVKWCKEQNLEFDKINDNTDENKVYYGNDTRKIFAHYYIDDKNVNFKEMKRRTI